jgi:translation initiation factor 3 subunit G
MCACVCSVPISRTTHSTRTQELFRPFGHVTRVYVAVDRITGENRGFAFINFAHRWVGGPAVRMIQSARRVLTYSVRHCACACHRDDAERAVRVMNGYGYDNLILRVEWAAPRAERG